MASRPQRPVDAALAYAARGWAVFPLDSILSGRCSCRRDCPHTAKHPIARHGFCDATTDDATIRSWWDRWPWANIAVATGKVSELVVIDVDPANGGNESLAHLQSLMGSLPETLTARTGGGGVHLLYAHPGSELRNTAGRLPGIAEPLLGVDLRGDGGYIVAAPSRHRSGACYSWIDPAAPVVAAPPWLRPWLRRHFPTSRPSWPRLRRDGGSRYGLAALQRELAVLRRAPVGKRNNQLNRAAFCLGMLTAGGELDETVVEEALRRVALEVGLSGIETDASIRSGLRAGASEPCRRPGA